MKSFKSTQGLTLIEVLVALAIIAIAMTAVIKAAAQHIKSTTYLQDKAIAYWVANNVMAEARLGLIDLPDNTDNIHRRSYMLSQPWYWQLSVASTSNKHINKLTVDVFTDHSGWQQDNAASVLSLTGYVYREKAE